jgi:ribosome-binding protein aMBF1 (putative translation factor)
MELDNFGAVRGERPEAWTRGERPGVWIHGERHTLSGETAAMLRAARQRRGWSLRMAGTKAHVAFGHIAMMETGTRAPSVVVARRLAAVYQLGEAETAQLLAESVAGAGRDYRGGTR